MRLEDLRTLFQISLRIRQYHKSTYPTGSCLLYTSPDTETGTEDGGDTSYDSLSDYLNEDDIPDYKLQENNRSKGCLLYTSVPAALPPESVAATVFVSAVALESVLVGNLVPYFINFPYS